jgi:hypothetical protein
MDYRRHYAALIERARTRQLETYGEWHHVIPRCLGGSDDATNIVKLTPEEHYVAHQLLVKMHRGNNKLVFAAHAMLMAGKRRGIAYTVNNKEFGWLRRLNARALSEHKRGKPRPPHVGEAVRAASLGRKLSEETKAKMSAAKKGRPKTPEHAAKVSAALKGKPSSRLGVTLSHETKEKMRVAATGRKMSAESIAKTVSSRSPEQRRNIALRAWETKRARAQTDEARP